MPVRLSTKPKLVKTALQMLSAGGLLDLFLIVQLGVVNSGLNHDRVPCILAFLNCRIKWRTSIHQHRGAADA